MVNWNCKILATYQYESSHSETLEEMVYYKELSFNKNYGKNTLWVRPLKMFKEKVEVEGKKIPRFKFFGSKP